jgi:predicted RNA-binding Zn ribbon-like protein
VEHDWEWLGDDLAIDFANTLRRRGMDYEELLAEPSDLREWASRQEGRVPVPPAAAARDGLGRVRGVRDDAFAVLRAAAVRAPLPREPAGRLNRVALRHPVIAQLGAEARVGGRPDRLDELLARAVAATIDLAAHAETAGLALCDAPSCGQFFLRERDNQRWCGPACGTRARVARHAHRRAARR